MSGTNKPKYRWDTHYGVCIGDEQKQQLIVTSTKKFREYCGKLLVAVLNNAVKDKR